MEDKALERLKARIYKEELKRNALPKSQSIENKAKRIAELAEKKKRETGF